MDQLKFILFFSILLISTGSNATKVLLSNGDVINGTIVENAVGTDGENTTTLQHSVLGLIVLSDAKVIIPKEKPADHGLLNTELLKDWDRSVELGVKGNEGNTRNLHIHAGTRLKFENEIKRWDIEMAYDSSEDSGETSRNQLFARFNRDFLIPSASHFYFTEGRYDWDEFEEWDYRLTFGGGVGEKLVNTESWKVNGRIGLGINKEFGGEDGDWTPEGLLGIDSNWQIAERHSLEFRSTFYPSLKDFGEFRNISTLNWKIGLDQLNGLSLKVGLLNEYDSDVAADSRKNDFKYNLSLVLGI